MSVMYVVTYNERMRTQTLSSARANLAAVCDAVIDDAEPIVLTRVGHESVVVLSLEEYNSMRETMYLLRSPANARRLSKAMAAFDAGEGFERELIDA